ncbi:MAG: hypothetical protein ACRDH9_10680 [Actinomycetota bacterium]
MGESSAATVEEIEGIRDRLEVNFRELERRMPAPAIWGKRFAGIAIGGGVGALVLRQVLKRTKRSRSPEKKTKRAIAKATPTQAVPEEVVGKGPKAFEDGKWKRYAAVGAGVWLAFTLIELRQLRKLNRALLTGRPGS